MKIENVPIAKLSSDPANARKHGEKNLASIIASLKRFGQQKPIVIDKSGVVRAGNGTLEAAIHLGWDKIACVRTSLENTDAVAYAIADNRTAELAEWDDEVLSSLLAELAGESDELFQATGFNQEDLDDLLADTGLGDDDEENIYSDKSDPPAYDIVGEKPELNDVYDMEYTERLIEKIENSSASPEVKTFLTASAFRHTKFHFERIAEWYAHADEEVQQLMEDSALVIVDLQSAIENGWTRLSSDLEDLYEQEQTDGE